MIGRPAGRVLLLGGVVAFVLLVLGLGLWAVGSPMERRLQKLDEQRVEDLRRLSCAIDLFWKKEQRLPRDLSELAAWEGLQEPRSDPSSDEPYEYRPGTEAEYRLCATFAREETDPLPRERYGGGPSLWHHPAGQKCFDLEVEPEEED